MKTEYQVEYTPTFAKHYKKLPLTIRKKAERKELLLRENPFSPLLKTHKLSGRLEAYWSFSIDYHYRIIFRVVKPKILLLVDVGTHEVYR